MDFLNELNGVQQRAAETGDGATLIIAGPGTGKTKTLTARIAYLVENEKVSLSEIIALTFTNKAAREMRQRLQAILQNKKLPKICTFHALGADLLKRDGNDRQLVKELERQEIIRALKKPAEFKGLSLRELSLIISRAKTSIEAPADAAVQLLKNYEAALTGRGLHDFDDLLCRSYELLKSDASRRPNYRYVLVDEFQDTSELQYEIVKLLGAGENIFAIGDPNQSIYSFRGAGAETFETFEKYFPKVQKIDLTINYRSRPEIINLANAIFPDSPQLVAQTKEAGKAQALQTLNEYSEAAYVLNEIERGIGGSDFLKAHADTEARQPRDYAVLYRTHRAAKTLQRAFSEAGVPFRIAGEGSPYEKQEVQSVITELREAESSDKASVYDLAKQIVRAKDLQTESVQQFLNSLVQFGTDIEACLKHIDEIAEQEFYDPSVNAVTLMTIHAAKGLEFEHVFLIAAEEGILPRPKADDLAEERRLFYVAATRAKETLEIIYTKTRGGEQAKPSRFIIELSEKTLPRTTDPNLPALKKRQQKRAQTSLF